MEFKIETVEYVLEYLEVISFIESDQWINEKEKIRNSVDISLLNLLDQAKTIE